MLFLRGQKQGVIKKYVFLLSLEIFFQEKPQRSWLTSGCKKWTLTGNPKIILLLFVENSVKSVKEIGR